MPIMTKVDFLKYVCLSLYYADYEWQQVSGLIDLSQIASCQSMVNGLGIKVSLRSGETIYLKMTAERLAELMDEASAATTIP